MYKVYDPNNGSYVSDRVFSTIREALDWVALDELDEDEEIPDWTIENLNDETESISIRNEGYLLGARTE